MWAVVPISDKLVQSLDKLRPGRPSFAALDLELTNAATPCVLSLSLALSFVVWTFPHTATAALNQWTARGPKGGEIDSLAIDPSHPATLYAGAFWGGVFKSTDSGVHWSQMTNGMDPLAIVRALAVDPTNSENVYAGTSSGLYTSNDGGATWSLGLYRDVQAVAVDPATPTTVYAGTCSDPDGLYKSTDGGVNWSASNSGLPTHCVDSLAVDPVSTGTIYAGTTGQLSNGVFKSTNGAASWSPSGLAQYTVFDLIVDPSNHSTIYAIGNGADKSTDGGQTWSRMSAGQYVVALALVASDPSVLYAATGSGVKGSSDGGATWAVSGPNPPSGVSVLAVNPNRSSVLFAATNLSGVYTSIRSGSSWTSTSAGLYAQEIPALAVAFGPSNAVYAGTWHGFFESFDSGDMGPPNGRSRRPAHPGRGHQPGERSRCVRGDRLRGLSKPRRRPNMGDGEYPSVRPGADLDRHRSRDAVDPLRHDGLPRGLQEHGRWGHLGPFEHGAPLRRRVPHRGRPHGSVERLCLGRKSDRGVPELGWRCDLVGRRADALRPNRSHHRRYKRDSVRRGPVRVLPGQTSSNRFVVVDYGQHERCRRPRDPGRSDEPIEALCGNGIFRCSRQHERRVELDTIEFGSDRTGYPPPAAQSNGEHPLRGRGRRRSIRLRVFVDFASAAGRGGFKSMHSPQAEEVNRAPAARG